MLKKIFNNLKRSQKEAEVFSVWRENIDYIKTLKKNNVVVTSVKSGDSFFLLLFLLDKVFFMEKTKNHPFKVISGKVHENMVENEKVWECIKYSKKNGQVMETSSLTMYLCEKIEEVRDDLNIEFQEEREIWYDINMFLSEIDTVGVKIPSYKEGENLWVD